MKITRFNLEDYEKLIKLWNDCDLSYRPDGRDSKQNIAKQIQHKTNYFLAAYEDDRLIGFIMASHNFRKGWINRLAVLTSFQRQGLAGKLLREAERLIEDDGVEITACLIEDWNQVSLNFFKQQKFIRHPDIFYLTKRESSKI